MFRRALDMAHQLSDLLHARVGTGDVHHVAGLNVDVPFERDIDTQTLRLSFMRAEAPLLFDGIPYRGFRIADPTVRAASLSAGE